MENKLKISEETLGYLIDEEAKKIVGEVLKRFEIPIEVKKELDKPIVLNEEDIKNLKSQIKNLLYEFFRGLKKLIIINGKESISLEIQK